jgi:hypothetical protein
MSSREIAFDQTSRRSVKLERRLVAKSGRSHGVRLMLALGFNISSKSNDDFSELAAVLQVAVDFHHIVELEYAIDDRLERAARKALGDVLNRDLPACLVARDQPESSREENR